MIQKYSDPITLSAPVERAGADPITVVKLRKPDVGTMRGMRLMELMVSDVNALCTLLPRITEPSLLPGEIEALDAADFADMALAVTSFFASSRMLAAAQPAGG